ncbi:response regulator transcription factor [Lachnospira pectinoschiza]|uniref:Stage 0 sporulation protein A homolog n=1 Tax=Lachnospira pectinoschiza TaxID=28052 RepID=A0A1G9WKI8_9FIRM|nr:response regulator transcription factor [Lachnospira pectinoschiza]SDM84857.1 DNA-binding response regulator, OmpR family, contains REC and winged-helix (wHTH) domain [Lachnospira pectinoschiza]
MDNITVLLVDDDSEVIDLNKKFFEKKNYRVYTAYSSKDALDILKMNRVDCILLDVMMPDMDGFEACSKMRKLTNVPILFLTGKDSEEDKIKGLEVGGDDFILKPYSLNEINARIQANVRRFRQYNKSLIGEEIIQESRGEKSSAIEQFGHLSVNYLAHKVYCDGDEIGLSNREYEILVILLSHNGEVTTFEEISNKLFGTYSDTDRQTIMVQISRLRKKLDAYLNICDMITSVRFKGYEFHAK